MSRLLLGAACVALAAAAQAGPEAAGAREDAAGARVTNQQPPRASEPPAQAPGAVPTTGPRSAGEQPSAKDGAPAESSASLGAVTVTATPSKGEVTIGESFTIDVKASGPAGTTFTFPGEAAAEELELRTAPAAPGAPPAAPGTHRYEAQLFALGELRVPGLPVRYTLPDGTSGDAVSGEFTIKVGSLLPKSEDEQKLADIRGPAAVGVGRPFWIALAVVVLAIAALLWLWLRRRREPDVTRVRVPALAPDAEALAALEALSREGLPARGELRAFYIRLSVILKRYLERRLEAPVLEMTSAETLSFLRAHGQGSELLPAVRDVAEAADRIKFAKGEGLVAEAERHLASVRALVASLEAKLRPPPAEPATGKAA